MTHTLELEVRDYECDIQGVVNNSVYQNYLEHARHKYLLDLGIDFAELARQSINLVVIRAELDYKSSLRPGEMFTIETRINRISKLKFAFEQKIITSEGKPAVNALIIGTAINERGRPFMPEFISDLLDNNA
ncbi:MAG: acyl-CoA thioesterase [Gammaproteobacteria bacterium]|nr:MAG: acyl-CoA thioesterase [Gammaproteobacteria bacterium]